MVESAAKPSLSERVNRVVDRVRTVAADVIEQVPELRDAGVLPPVVTSESQAAARAQFSADPVARLFQHRVGGAQCAANTDNCYCCQTARASRALSALAYQTPENIRTEAARLGFDQVRMIEDAATGTQGFVASNGEQSYVVFRGTEEARDLRTCFSLKKTPAHGGQVHRGFKQSADAVSSQVRDALAEIGTGQQTVVCGHSLGGAVAELTALDLEKSGHRVEGVHVFGAPRVGDRAFAAEYDQHLAGRTHLHVRPNDPIPRVPPRFMGFADVAGGRGRNCQGEPVEVSPGALRELRMYRDILARAKGAGGDRDKLREALEPFIAQHRVSGYELT